VKKDIELNSELCSWKYVWHLRNWKSKRAFWHL